MKRYHHAVHFASFASAAVAGLLALIVAVTADAGELAFTELEVHGKPRCEGDATPPSVYVARRANDAGLPTDDVAIVEAFLESDTVLPDVLIAVYADLSVVRPGRIRDISKLFHRVLPDGSLLPLSHGLSVVQGPTPIRLELVRPLEDRLLRWLPLAIPIRLQAFSDGYGSALATSRDAEWRLVAAAGESIGSAPGGTLIQLPDGATAVDDAQVAVLHGCGTLPHVAYAVTGVAITGRGRTTLAQLKSVRVHSGSPGGPVISEATDQVAIRATGIGRHVIDLPDFLVGDDEAALLDFWVVVTFADGGTDILARTPLFDVAIPVDPGSVAYRDEMIEEFLPAENVAYAIDLLIDGRMQTAD